LGASVRAITSLDPPGVKPTTMVNREGHTCALAANAIVNNKNASTLRAGKNLRTAEKAA
jgi:hypothetical protein